MHTEQVNLSLPNKKLPNGLDISAMVANIVNKRHKHMVSDINSITAILTRVSFVEHDGFTVATVVNNDGYIMSAGASKRNLLDKNLPVRGRALALSRAIEHFIVVEWPRLLKAA